MIGLINAYRTAIDAPTYQLEYGPMFLDFLKKFYSTEDIKMFEVALTGVPSSIDECDGYIISGSPKSAYDKDPWILALSDFIRDCYKAKKKMVGVCFGHQLIAHALGGRTEKAKNGWGVGVREFHILKNKPWMKPSVSTASLLFSHQDQVVKLPKEAELLAEDDFCQNEMFSIGESVFCFQGHPEFTPTFAKNRLDTRIELVGRETYDRAVKTINNPTQNNEFGLWMKNFFKSP